MNELCEAYCHAVDLCLLLGYKNIKDKPDPIIVKVNDHWTFAINGSDGIKDVKIDGCGITNLNTFEMAIWVNGWLAAILIPSGGYMFGGHNNEDKFIKAIKERIKVEQLVKQMTLP